MADVYARLGSAPRAGEGERGGGRHSDTQHSLHCCQVAYFWATQLKSNGGGDNAVGQNMSDLQLIVFICKKFHANMSVI